MTYDMVNCQTLISIDECKELLRTISMIFLIPRPKTLSHLIC